MRLLHKRHIIKPFMVVAGGEPCFCLRFLAAKAKKETRSDRHGSEMVPGEGLCLIK